MPTMMDAAGIVFAADPRRPWLAARSARSLCRAGLHDPLVVSAGNPAVPPAPWAAGRPVLAVRAGSWFAAAGPIAPPPAPATGGPLVAVGLPRTGGHAAAWRAAAARCGGDFSGEPRLPPVACCWLTGEGDPAGRAALWRWLVDGAFDAAPPAGRRVVRWAAFDVWSDEPAAVADGPGGGGSVPTPDGTDRVEAGVWTGEPASRVRVLQVVTTLQQGGAERVTWDLHQSLPAFGVAVGLVTLGRPLRRPLPDVPDRVDLSSLAAEERAAAVADLAGRFGADLIHAHLIRGDEAGRVARLSATPLVLTVHNTRTGWPPELAELGPGVAALLVACARVVEREVLAAALPAPARTAWNGIDAGAYAAPAGAGRPRSDGRSTGRLTLACVANPRPQKRLHLLPAVLAAVRDELCRRGDRREPRLILAGEAGGDAAGDCLAEVWRAAAAAGVADRIEWTAGRRPVADVLAEADVFVSVSAHEGLSLAQLEALAAGLPVVTTDVGGAGEVAYRNPAVTLVPVDAPPGEVAAAVVAAAAASAGVGLPPLPGAAVRGSPLPTPFPVTHPSAPPPGVAAVRRDFSRERMAGRYAWLYRAALGPPRGDVLWFVANNLSVGGAQSSLRRLVKRLHADGVPVRVAVLQEHPAHPTSGREDLAAAGVPVTVLPPAGSVEVEDAVGRLLGELSAAPPRSVAFWNVIQSYKLLLADALLRVPVFDVSPGEMYYDSLDRYLERLRPGLPYRSARDYGERLAGVVVKYAAEAPTAADRLGAPVHVIPNGVPLAAEVDRALAAAGREARAAAGGLVIGTAARLHPHKRIEDLIDALRLAQPRLPAGTVFRVVGGPDAGCDDYVAALRERAAGLPVEWAGEVVGGGPLHAGSDLFAMVSEPAGCPNASLEAMAEGLPVVATDVGGAGEQVVDGVTGRLVPPRDVAALADALADVGASADRRRAMGRAAGRRVAERFSLDGMVRAYRELLSSG